jgi:hypothetical protein
MIALDCCSQSRYRFVDRQEQLLNACTPTCPLILHAATVRTVAVTPPALNRAPTPAADHAL